MAFEQMTLDELADQFEASSDDPVVRRLGRLLRDWKTTDATVTDLSQAVNHYFGTSWIVSDVEHDEAFEAWARFSDRILGQMGVMTMNERLYHLGLLERFDRAKPDRRVLYQKLLAEQE